MWWILSILMLVCLSIIVVISCVMMVVVSIVCRFGVIYYVVVSGSSWNRNVLIVWFVLNMLNCLVLLIVLVNIYDMFVSGIVSVSYGSVRYILCCIVVDIFVKYVV